MDTLHRRTFRLCIEAHSEAPGKTDKSISFTLGPWLQFAIPNFNLALNFIKGT